MNSQGDGSESGSEIEVPTAKGGTEGSARDPASRFERPSLDDLQKESQNPLTEQAEASQPEELQSRPSEEPEASQPEGPPSQLVEEAPYKVEQTTVAEKESAPTELARDWSLAYDTYRSVSPEQRQAFAREIYGKEGAEFFSAVDGKPELREMFEKYAEIYKNEIKNPSPRMSVGDPAAEPYMKRIEQFRTTLGDLRSNWISGPLVEMAKRCYPEDREKWEKAGGMGHALWGTARAVGAPRVNAVEIQVNVDKARLK